MSQSVRATVIGSATTPVLQDFVLLSIYGSHEKHLQHQIGHSKYTACSYLQQDGLEWSKYTLGGALRVPMQAVIGGA